ncbi:MAG: nuclear transport factor 2 family protein [Spirosomataceae bacterium]
MKKLMTLLTATIAMIACNNQTSSNRTPSENENIIRQYYEYFNKHDWEKMAEMYVEVSDFKDPSLGQGIVKQTRQQTIEKYRGLSEMFPDVKDTIIQIYPSGDKHIIVEFISTGTAPDGSKFELPICTIFTIENGKITKDFTYYDNFEDEQKK